MMIILFAHDEKPTLSIVAAKRRYLKKISCTPKIKLLPTDAEKATALHIKSKAKLKHDAERVKQKFCRSTRLLYLCIK